LQAFRGGIHPPEHKSQAHQLDSFPLPADLFIPLAQHIGKPAKLLVKKGEMVEAGQVLAEASAFVSLPIHAPVAAKVQAIVMRPALSGRPEQMVHLRLKEGVGETFVPPRVFAPLDLQATAEALQKRAREAGIAGQGGAAFPMCVKLNPPKEKNVQLLLVNACECEPFLTRDDRLMQDRAQSLMQAVRLTARAMGLHKCIIGIEDNKPESIAQLQEACKTVTSIEVSVLALPTRYPQGAEKMLIRAATGREVPEGGLPMDVGCAIQNVGTLLAFRDACIEGMPACSATLSLDGDGIERARNLLVPIGTTLADILASCGPLPEGDHLLIAGGPMMGSAQQDLGAPVVKACSGLLLMKAQTFHQARACLRCGKCVDACPMGLLPAQITRRVEVLQGEGIESMHLGSCMECGCCAYVCPSDRPLVQWLREGKWRLKKREIAS
jgi:Na+-translocating ferredoxin:NAD+ oxidoreductase subunit C